MAGYKDNKLVALKLINVEASTDFLNQSLDGEFDKIKIMTWDDTEISPLSAGEVFKNYKSY